MLMLIYGVQMTIEMILLLNDISSFHKSVYISIYLYIPLYIHVYVYIYSGYKFPWSPWAALSWIQGGSEPHDWVGILLLFTIHFSLSFMKHNQT
jgi:cellulose synthase/poly-beta-1,6-N-acetylglucosamine synthase-like glycosyltransferase